MNIKKYAASILMVAAFAVAVTVPITAFAGWPAQQVRLSLNATNGGVIVSFTTPPAPAGTTLTSLDVRFDTSPINSFNFSSHPQVMWWTNPGTPGTVQNAVVTGLNTNTSYYFAVRFQNSAGSSSIISVSTPPVILTGNATYSVVLVWTPSVSTNVAGYKIYSGTNSGVYYQVTAVGNITTVTLIGLQWGVLYYYAATAVDVNGVESQFSNETSYQRP